MGELRWAGAPLLAPARPDAAGRGRPDIRSTGKGRRGAARAAMGEADRHGAAGAAMDVASAAGAAADAGRRHAVGTSRVVSAALAAVIRSLTSRSVAEERAAGPDVPRSGLWPWMGTMQHRPGRRGNCGSRMAPDRRARGDKLPADRRALHPEGSVPDDPTSWHHPGRAWTRCDRHTTVAMAHAAADGKRRTRPCAVDAAIAPPPAFVLA